MTDHLNADRSESASATTDGLAAARPVRVLVNGTSARVGGGLTVLAHQLRAFAAHPPANELTVLAAPWNIERLETETRAAVGAAPGGSHITIELVELESTQDRIRFEQTQLAARSGGFDLLYNPANLAPLRAVPVPSVLMLQNVAYFADGPSFASHQTPVERLKRRMVRGSVNKCDAVVVPSQALADAVVGDLPNAASKIHLVPPGPFSSNAAGRPDSSDAVRPTAVRSVSPDRLAPATAAAAHALQTHIVGSGYVLSVANYYDYKRLDDVVGAWGRADAEGLDRDLLMIGSMPDDVINELRQLIPVERRDRLHFHGSVSAPDLLRTAYLGAAAVLHLSALECLSLVPVEAAALGVPVVMSDIAVHRELGEPHGLRMVPVGDRTAAAEAIAQAVADPPPSPVNLLSEWSHHVAALQALFVDLVEEGAGDHTTKGGLASGWRSLSRRIGR